MPIFQHPNFTFFNDVALARLTTPAKVKPLTMATDSSENFAQENCTILGWGHRIGKQLITYVKSLIFVGIPLCCTLPDTTFQ